MSSGSGGRRAFAVHREGRLATVTIQRRHKRNAFDLAMWQAVPEVIASAVGGDIRVLILRGEPGADFSAGADISEFIAARREPGHAEVYGAAVRAAAEALSGVRVPTIAAIEGYCVGGGCQLAVACDIRVASETARFGITAARLGVIYSLDATRQLVGVVGAAWARYLLLTGARLPADRAERIGLVHQVSSYATFEADLAALAAGIAGLAPLSLSSAKKLINFVSSGRADAPDMEDLDRESFSSADYLEGINAFLEGRPPRFGSLGHVPAAVLAERASLRPGEASALPVPSVTSGTFPQRLGGFFSSKP